MNAVQVGGVSRSNQPGTDNQPLLLAEALQHLHFDRADATQALLQQDTTGRSQRGLQDPAVLRRALALAEKTLGPDHLSISHALNNLAALYEAQHRYAEAEPLLKRSLAIFEKALGPNHPDVAALLENMAAVYRAEGRTADAEPLVRRSMAIRRQAGGPGPERAQ